MAALAKILAKIGLGSDVFLHYTARYTWMSNQMAHVMMGFFFANLWAFIGWHPLAFLIWPVVKDAGDFAVDMGREGRVFAVDASRRAELIRDWVTDDFFWSVGVVLTLLFRLGFGDGQWFWWVAGGVYILAGILIAGFYFVKQKDVYDASALPFYFRLPNFNKPITAEAVAAVERFIANQGGRPPVHLLITGSPQSGRTSLAVGIGSGFCARREKVRYISAYDLLNEVMTGRDEHTGRLVAPQPLAEAPTLIVDDLYLQSFGPKDHSTWREAAGKDAFKDLAKKAMVWVLNDPDDMDAWRAFLQDHLDIDESRVTVIALQGGPS